MYNSMVYKGPCIYLELEFWAIPSRMKATSLFPFDLLVVGRVAIVVLPNSCPRTDLIQVLLVLLPEI